MAMLSRLLLSLLLAFGIASGLASSEVEVVERQAASIINILGALQYAHGEYTTQRDSRKLERRDSTPGYRGRLSNYWKPIDPSQRPDPADDFADQLAILVTDLGAAVEQLIALLASEFNLGALLPSSGASSPTILPITNVGTHSTHPTLHVTSHASTSAASSTSTSPPSSATYTFNARASNLNVVYYSQTDLTSIISLSRVCNDPSVDIVNIAFVTALISDGGYPAMNMASNCWAPNAAQQAAGATRLLDCVGDGFASQIAACQCSGRKVLLSLGGSVGDLTLPSDEKAVEVAHTLWNLFLGGSDPNVTPLRPYGDFVFDGIDIDNESPSASTYLPTLVSTLRQLMATASKPYYLSAAPQCPRPDASIPVAQLLGDIDFFSVQFYNNPSCQLSAPGDAFFTSLQAWSNDLQQPLPAPLSSPGRIRRSVMEGQGVARMNHRRRQDLHNGITSPRLLIGTPAFPGAGSGYVNVSQYMSILERVKAMNLTNLAGAMFWDGAYLQVSGQAVEGVSGNMTFADVVRDVLA